MRSRKRVLGLGIFLSIAFSLFISIQSAFAYTSMARLENKVKALDILYCYNSELGSPALPTTVVPATDYNTTYGVVNSKDVPAITDKDGNNGTINCQKLLKDYYGSLPTASDTAGVISYLTDLGYVKTGSGTDSKVCFGFSLKTSEGDMKTNSLCYLFDDKGRIDASTYYIEDDPGNLRYVLNSADGYSIKLIDTAEYHNPDGTLNTEASHEIEILNLGPISESELKTEVNKAAGTIKTFLAGQSSYSGVSIDSVSGSTKSTGKAISDTYTLTNPGSAATKFLQAHTEYRNFSETFFDQYEQHSYYKNYLMNEWGFTIDENWCSKTKKADTIPFKTAPSDITYCGLLDPSGNHVAGSSANGEFRAHALTQASGNGYINTKDNNMSVSDAMSALNSLDYGAQSMVDAGENGLGAAPCVPGEEEGCEEEEDDEGGGGGGVNPADPADSSGWSLDKCYEVAGVAGWIVCPAVDFMKTMMETAYSKLIQPMLEANPGILGSDTQKAWGTFRDFANIIFAFILLLVILSQVTGYGIDNYGIKRMLPKLIIGAILVNFSFFICKVALDIANITGVGLQNMLSSIGGSGTDLGTHIGSMVGGLLTFAVGGTLAVGAGVALTGGWAFLLPAILALISGVISFLFLFVILGVRQAGIIILAVASPVALVLYVLPNTQSWAKRWVKMFGQLLLAYPIIGAVIGGCYAASNIIMGIGGNEFWTYLAGTLLAVVPYLMIPTILRSSMTALGALGTAVTGFGQRMAGGITGAAGNAIRQSGAFQSTLNRSAGLRADRTRRAETQSAQRTIDRLNRIKARGGTLSARQEGELNRAKRTMNANVRADAADRRAEMEYERINSPAGQAALERGLEAEAETAAIRDESAVLDRGGYKYDASAVAAGAPSGTVDANDLNSLKQALEYETSQNGPQNVARIMALKQMMESKYAKKGMDAVGDVIDSGNMKGEGAKRVINSVASDGNYKNQARSIFGAANDIKKDTAFQASGAVAGGQVSAMRNNGGQVGNMKAENIGQMTDNEFAAFAEQYRNANADIRANAGRMAQEALDDDSIRSQLNSDQIAQLETLARNTGQVSAASALQQEQDRVFNIQQQAIDQQHQQFAFAQGTDKDGFYVAPSGWKTIHVNGGGANNNRYATDPNNPNRVYDRKTNKFINR